MSYVFVYATCTFVFLYTYIYVYYFMDIQIAVNIQWKIAVNCFGKEAQFSNLHKGRTWAISGAALFWRFIILIVWIMRCYNTLLILNQ